MSCRSSLRTVMYTGYLQEAAGGWVGGSGEGWVRHGHLPGVGACQYFEAALFLLDNVLPCSKLKPTCLFCGNAAALHPAGP
jgi:hypothetical protein